MIKIIKVSISILFLLGALLGCSADRKLRAIDNQYGTDKIISYVRENHPDKFERRSVIDSLPKFIPISDSALLDAYNMGDEDRTIKVQHDVDSLIHLKKECEQEAKSLDSLLHAQERQTARANILKITGDLVSINKDSIRIHSWVKNGKQFHEAESIKKIKTEERKESPCPEQNTITVTKQESPWHFNNWGFISVLEFLVLAFAFFLHFKK